jgi:hypothetical protein
MMNHKQKVKLGRKMRTHSELVQRVSIFSSKAWERRKKAIADRVNRRMEEVKSVFVAEQKESKKEVEAWEKPTLLGKVKRLWKKD